jgi:hypothetical protein
MWQSDAVLAHDASSALERVLAPTLVTFGAHDLVTFNGATVDFLLRHDG